MTHHEIDTTHPANRSPADATTEQIADALDGRLLFNRLLLMKFDGRCRRCEDKNSRRRAFGVEPERERIADGEEVSFFAYYNNDRDLDSAPDGYWRISKVIHADHPLVPFEYVTHDAHPQVRGKANVDVVEGEGHRITNVAIEERSPLGEGGENPVVEQRQQEYVTDGTDDHPEGVIAIPPDEPEPTWPRPERQWLDELVANNERVPRDDRPAVIPDEMLQGLDGASEPQQQTGDAHDLEGKYISVMDDAHAPDEGIIYSHNVWLTRCDTDRPLYSLFVDGEIEFTIDASELTATHQIEELLKKAASGNLDEFTAGGAAPNRG